MGILVGPQFSFSEAPFRITLNAKPHWGHAAKKTPRLTPLTGGFGVVLFWVCDDFGEEWIQRYYPQDRSYIAIRGSLGQASLEKFEFIFAFALIKVCQASTRAPPISIATGVPGFITFSKPYKPYTLKPKPYYWVGCNGGPERSGVGSVTGLFVEIPRGIAIFTFTIPTDVEEIAAMGTTHEFENSCLVGLQDMG